MEDYRFYAGMQNEVSPFWERKDQSGGSRFPSDTRLRPNQLDVTNEVHAAESDENTQKVAGLGVGIAGLLTENLLIHPFVVLRRQCQVHSHIGRYHLQPFTLIPVVVYFGKQQGLASLWKGIGSVLIVRGMTMAVEDLISKITPLPKEISRHSSLKTIGQHLLLKCLSLAVITPIYSASLVETVQSDVASEKPGIFDVFKEGACRLLSWSSPNKGRMIPVWVLVAPTVAHGILQYIISGLVKAGTLIVMKKNSQKEHRRQGAIPRDPASQFDQQAAEMSANLVGHLVADVALFPLEVALHRLHLQGTRTIIDNLGPGAIVIPILTSYRGVLDCFQTTVAEEGRMGLWKGFGALVLQYTAHFLLLKVLRTVIIEAANLFKPSPPPRISASIQPVMNENEVVDLPSRKPVAPQDMFEMELSHPKRNTVPTG